MTKGPGCRHPARGSLPPMAGGRISVVVPLHNGADHCVAAVASVLDQTRPPDEVIVVDDGSDDLGAEAITAYLADRRSPVPVKVERQTNQGQSAARNAGVRLATGDLVAFCDQDDTWTPTHLEVLAGRLEAAPPDVGWVYSDFDEVDGAGRLVTRGYRTRHGVASDLRSVDQVIAHDLMVLPSASVLRRGAFDAVGGFDPELSGYEDDDLYLRMFRAGYRIVGVDDPLTIYRVHPQGSSASPSFQRSRVRYLAKVRDALPDHVRSNRYWVHDVCYPRLHEATLLEYAAMLRAGDRAAAAALGVTATELARTAGATGRRRRLACWTLRHPRVLRTVATGLRVVPPPVRPRVGPGLRAVLSALGVRCRPA